MSGELLIDLDEVGRRLSVCKRHVQQLVHDGALPSVKLGRSRRVAVADLVGYVEWLRNENDRDAAGLAVVGGGQRRGLAHRG
jgi:excisionase family DNA binding protein